MGVSRTATDNEVNEFFGKGNLAIEKLTTYVLRLILANNTNDLKWTLVIAPRDYPQIVMNEQHKEIILNYLFENAKKREKRKKRSMQQAEPAQAAPVAQQANGQGIKEEEEIDANKVLHRSGTVVVEVSSALAAKFVRFTAPTYNAHDIGFPLTVHNFETILHGMGAGQPRHLRALR